VSTRTVGAKASLDPQSVEALLAGAHGDPFAVLGVQEAEGRLIARCVIEGAEEVEAFTLAGEPVGALARTHEAGFFEGRFR
jgi:1,4-alpha-glucan branching enzyme